MNYMKKLGLVVMSGLCFAPGTEGAANQTAGQNAAQNTNQQQTVSQEERDAAARVAALRAQVSNQTAEVSSLQNSVTQAASIVQNMQNQQAAVQRQVAQTTQQAQNAVPTFLVQDKPIHRRSFA